MTTERMRARVHAAADRIEIPAIDPQEVVGTVRDQRPPTRRPVALAVAASVAVGAVLGTTLWAALPDDPTPAANTEPVTPGALVAIALDHIDAEPSYYERDNRAVSEGTSAAIRFGSNGEYDGDQVSLLVGRGAGPEWLGCDQFGDGCATIDTPTGEVTLGWDEVAPEEDPGIVYVSQRREDGFAMVGYSGQSIIGDPREQTLPVTVDEMVDIVSDPAFGPATTEEWAEAGDEIDWDYRAERPTAEETIPPSTTPRALAAAVEEHLNDEGFAGIIVAGREETFVEPRGPMRDGWGLRIDLEGGYTLHVTVLAGSGPFFLECQRTLTCWDFEGLVLAGRPGLAGVFRSDRVAGSHVWLEGPGIDPRGVADFGMGQTFEGEPEADVELLVAVVRLVNAPGISQQTSQQWIDLGERVDWLG